MLRNTMAFSFYQLWSLDNEVFKLTNSFRGSSYLFNHHPGLVQDLDKHLYQGNCLIHNQNLHGVQVFNSCSFQHLVRILGKSYYLNVFNIINKIHIILLIFRRFKKFPYTSQKVSKFSLFMQGIFFLKIWWENVKFGKKGEFLHTFS